jgi:hypothetical protein
MIRYHDESGADGDFKRCAVLAKRHLTLDAEPLSSQD